MKIILNVFFMLFLVSLLGSCKEEDNTSPDRIVEVTLKNTEEYSYDLMLSGDEEGAVIKTQAQHFERSELIRNESTAWSLVYHYKAIPNYTGADYVEIETCTGSDGGSACAARKLIKISFTITD